jgi:hypothetical protein
MLTQEKSSRAFLQSSHQSNPTPLTASLHVVGVCRVDFRLPFSPHSAPSTVQGGPSLLPVLVYTAP